ncbi:type I restriction-modification system [Francisella tularensis subsp. novicida GA99-3548]|uniref:restriction endonuclease subunit S n=1 Tax=Francisella tularensis TaxID=263 RepID=UPI000158AEEA|nr:restriction endonuclease subunit S [Francisella tularensis]AJI72994.1 type I restriction modification DNA specificity domain protein [Francisella tularensis subsp. novicida D9876]EDN37110.1 type I restriction-modification system [Francisella tularensis subsp. novicida GA99-3548]
MSNSELPKGWKAIELGEITSYVNRGVAPKYTDEHGITVINQKCIREGNINLELARVHNPDKKYTAEKQLHLGDILINSTGVGTAGRVGIFTDSINAIVDTHVSIVRLNKEYAYPKFVYYNLRFREKELEETAEGSTGQIELKRDAIKSLNILLPQLTEQKAIADVLSSLDDKIDLLHKQNQTLEDMAQTLFREWFIEKADEGWEEMPLSEVCSVTAGYAFKSKDFVDIGVPVVKIKNISNGHIDYNDLQFIDISESDVESKYRLYDNDIVMAMTGATIGKIGLVSTFEHDYLLLNQRVAVLRSNHQALLWFMLNSLDLENEILNLSNGAVQANISSTSIGQVPIPGMSNQMMQKFNNAVHPMFEKIQQNKKQIKSLEQTRDTLLPKLMSGQVRV